MNERDQSLIDGGPEDDPNPEPEPRVNVSQKGIRYYLVRCTICNFYQALNDDSFVGDMLDGVHRHVKKTGHPVITETTNETVYSLAGRER